MNDFRFAFRSLFKSPGFAVTALFTLALGLAVNAVSFSIANDLFFRPLPAEKPQQLTIIAQKSPVISYQVPLSYPDAQDLRRMVEGDAANEPDMKRAFAGMMAFNEQVVSLSSAGQTSERAWIHVATDNYFSVLGTQPYLGRFFLPQEAQTPGSEPVIVLTYNAWKRRFGENRSVIGQSIALNGISFTVIGVSAPGFFGALWGTELTGFVPVTMLTRLLPGGRNFALNRGNTCVFLMGRLREGIDVAQGRAATEVAFERIMRDHPGNYLPNARAVTMLESNSRPSPFVAQYAPKILAALSALALLVLIVAVANVAGLMYARSSQRERELAIRSAIGASRFQLVRCLLAESILLSLAAGVFGTLVSLWTLPLLLSIAPSPGAPAAQIAVDWHPAVATMVVALLTGVATGLLPALKASGLAPMAFLKETAPKTSLYRHPLRSALVAGQIALSCVVLVCSVLALRSLCLLSNNSPGFRTENILVASYDLNLQNYTAEQGRLFHDRLLERVRALPGVEAASLTTNIPLDVRTPQLGGIRAPDDSPRDVTQRPPVIYIVAEHNYLSTLGLAVEKGRDFNALDRSGAQRAVIINQVLAHQLFGEKDPLGQHIFIQNDKAPTVVGVIGKTHYYNLGVDTQPLMIDLLDQNYRGNASLVVRSSRPPESLTSDISKIVRELDPALPLYGVQTLKQHIKQSPSGLMPYRMGSIIAGVQGAIALLLSATGIFGLLASNVAHRTREIGVRMALGASLFNVIVTVTRNSVILMLAGIVLGMAAAVVISKLLAGLLYGAGHYDTAIFVGVALMIFATGSLACWLPARRAAQVNPIDALRSE